MLIFAGMRPEIRELLWPIYHDQLRDHESVLGRDPVQGMGGVNTFWHCHNAFEDTMSGDTYGAGFLSPRTTSHC